MKMVYSQQVKNFEKICIYHNDDKFQQGSEL